MRGPTETSTAFNSSKFEELRNLSLIEPLNSFKKSNFFSILGAILDSSSEIDLFSDVGFVVFSACSSFLLFSCFVLLLCSSVSFVLTSSTKIRHYWSRNSLNNLCENCKIYFQEIFYHKGKLVLKICVYMCLITYMPQSCLNMKIVKK